MRTSKLIILLAIGTYLLKPVTGFTQENSTGIFITIKVNKKHKTKGYGRRVYNRSHREKFLIPDVPLITSTEFVSVTEINHDSRALHSYFSISVSPEGLQKLRAAVQTLINADLVLVIDNTVFGRINSKSEDDFRMSKITIVSPLKDLDLEWAHQKLAEMVEARKK